MWSWGKETDLPSSRPLTLSCCRTVWRQSWHVSSNEVPLYLKTPCTQGQTRFVPLNCEVIALHFPAPMMRVVAGWHLFESDVSLCKGLLKLGNGRFSSCRFVVSNDSGARSEAILLLWISRTNARKVRMREKLKVRKCECEERANARNARKVRRTRSGTETKTDASDDFTKQRQNGGTLLRNSHLM